MADEAKTEMVESEKEKEPVKQPDGKVEITKTKEQLETEAELEKLRKALKDANKEAAERRVRLDELEKAEADRKAAQMSEQEKLQAKLRELESSIAQRDALLKEKERQELQRKVAKAVGLPDGFAERLRGDTEEELTADANTVLELLPKQTQGTEKPKLPKPDVTNPGDAKKGETREQMKQRALGRNVNTFDSEFGKNHGGGVSFVEKQ